MSRGEQTRLQSRARAAVHIHTHTRARARALALAQELGNSLTRSTHTSMRMKYKQGYLRPGTRKFAGVTDFFPPALNLSFQGMQLYVPFKQVYGFSSHSWCQ